MAQASSAGSRSWLERAREMHGDETAFKPRIGHFRHRTAPGAIFGITMRRTGAEAAGLAAILPAQHGFDARPAALEPRRAHTVELDLAQGAPLEIQARGKDAARQGKIGERQAAPGLALLRRRAVQRRIALDRLAR